MSSTVKTGQVKVKVNRMSCVTVKVMWVWSWDKTLINQYLMLILWNNYLSILRSYCLWINWELKTLMTLHFCIWQNPSR